MEFQFEVPLLVESSLKHLNHVVVATAFASAATPSVPLFGSANANLNEERESEKGREREKERERESERERGR